MLKIHLLWICIATLAGCTAQAPQGDSYPAVSIMTFNVQNLFDTRHDEGKNDYTYLPLGAKDNETHRARCATIDVEKWRLECTDLDWSDDVLRVKFERIAATILSNEGGRGADILVFQEVENVAVLEALRSGYLRDAGYQAPILLEGSDERGIDVAFMSRLPLVGSPRLHASKFRDISETRQKDTRGILEATFALPDGSLLTGFAVHFPAPYHPTHLRVQSYEFLASLAADLPAGRAIFAAGDFNTVRAEGNILDTIVEKDWRIAHRAGCANCPGTYYYAPNDDWSFLDMILVNRVLDGGGSPWRLAVEKTRIANAYPQQSSARGRPLAFVSPDRAGVSDHWPLRAELEYAAGR